MFLFDVQLTQPNQIWCQVDQEIATFEDNINITAAKNVFCLRSLFLYVMFLNAPSLDERFQEKFEQIWRIFVNVCVVWKDQFFWIKFLDSKPIVKL